MVRFPDQVARLLCHASNTRYLVSYLDVSVMAPMGAVTVAAAAE